MQWRNSIFFSLNSLRSIFVYLKKKFSFSFCQNTIHSLQSFAIKIIKKKKDLVGHSTALNARHLFTSEPQNWLVKFIIFKILRPTAYRVVLEEPFLFEGTKNFTDKSESLLEYIFTGFRYKHYVKFFIRIFYVTI